MTRATRALWGCIRLIHVMHNAAFVAPMQSAQGVPLCGPQRASSTAPHSPPKCTGGQQDVLFPCHGMCT